MIQDTLVKEYSFEWRHDGNRIMATGTVNGVHVAMIPEAVRKTMTGDQRLFPFSFHGSTVRNGMHLYIGSGRNGDYGEILGFDHPDVTVDYAVPFNHETKKYPYNGEAVSVYKHPFLPCGIVPFEKIKSQAADDVMTAFVEWLCGRENSDES